MPEKPEVTALRTRLGDECKERDELLKKLDQSLDLQALWPEVFEGEKGARVRLTGSSTAPATMTLEIRRGSDAVTRQFPLKDVPKPLLDFYIGRIPDPAHRALINRYIDMLQGARSRFWNRY